MDKLRRHLASIDARVGSLESGALAAVLDRMRDDAAQRQVRQALVDQQTRWRLAGQVLVTIALVALIVVVVGVGWGG